MGIRLMRYFVASVFAAFISLISSNGEAAGLDAAQAKIITDTARSICNTVVNIKGSDTHSNLQAEVEGQVSVILRRLVGAKASGTGTLSEDAFEGLTRDATAIALSGDRDCRERVLDKLLTTISDTSGEKDTDTAQPRSAGVFNAPGSTTYNQYLGHVKIKNCAHGIENHGMTNNTMMEEVEIDCGPPANAPSPSAPAKPARSVQ